MQWLNEPASWQRTDDLLQVNVDPGTDFWRVTGYGYIRDTGHVYGEVIAGDLDLKVCVRGSFASQYDQAGVMLRVDERTWLKTGVEFFEGRPRLSTVLTLGVSSWIVADLPDGMDELALRVSRRGDAVEVRYSVADGPAELAALVFLPPDREVLAGVMCAAPEGSGFRVTFRELRIVSRDWAEPGAGDGEGEWEPAGEDAAAGGAFGALADEAPFPDGTGQDDLTYEELSLNGLPLDGPVLDGPVLDGPVLDGPVLDGPDLHGLAHDEPVLEGRIVGSPVIEGQVVNGVELAARGLNGSGPGGPDAGGEPDPPVLNGSVIDGSINGAVSGSHLAGDPDLSGPDFSDPDFSDPDLGDPDFVLDRRVLDGPALDGSPVYGPADGEHAPGLPGYGGPAGRAGDEAGEPEAEAGADDHAPWAWLSPSTSDDAPEAAETGQQHPAPAAEEPETAEGAADGPAEPGTAGAPDQWSWLITDAGGWPGTSETDPHGVPPVLPGDDQPAPVPSLVLADPDDHWHGQAVTDPDVGPPVPAILDPADEWIGILTRDPGDD